MRNPSKPTYGSGFTLDIVPRRSAPAPGNRRAHPPRLVIATSLWVENPSGRVSKFFARPWRGGDRPGRRSVAPASTSLARSARSLTTNRTPQTRHIRPPARGFRTPRVTKTSYGGIAESGAAFENPVAAHGDASLAGGGFGVKNRVETPGGHQAAASTSSGSAFRSARSEYVRRDRSGRPSLRHSNPSRLIRGAALWPFVVYSGNGNLTCRETCVVLAGIHPEDHLFFCCARGQRSRNSHSCLVQMDVSSAG